MKSSHFIINPINSDTKPLTSRSNVFKILPARTYLKKKKNQKNLITFRNISIRKNKINNTTNNKSNFSSNASKNLSKNNIAWDDNTVKSSQSGRKKYSINMGNNSSFRESSIKNNKKYTISSAKSSMIPIFKYMSMASINNNESKKEKNSVLHLKTEDKMKNENIKLKNELCVLKKENNKLKKKIVLYQSKINKKKNTAITLKSIYLNKNNSNKNIDFFSHRNISTEINSLNECCNDLYYFSSKNDKNNKNSIKNYSGDKYKSADRNNFKGMISKDILSLYGLKDRTKNNFKDANKIYLRNSKLKKIKSKFLTNKKEINYITNNISRNNMLNKKLITSSNSNSLKKNKFVNISYKKIASKKLSSNKKINTIKQGKLKKTVNNCDNLNSRVIKLKRINFSTNQVLFSNSVRNVISNDLHSKMSNIFERTKKLLSTYEKITQNSQYNNV